jgi:hypothetical protein
MVDTAAAWKPGEIAQLRRLWAEDVPLREIGERIGGRSKGAISNKARRLGLTPRGNGGGYFRPDPARDRKLARMWRAGAAQKEIARATGIDVSNLWYHVARLGLPQRLGRGSGAMPAETVAAVDRALFRCLWRDRVPEAEIAARFGITVAVVRHIRDELRLSSRKKLSRVHRKPENDPPETRRLTPPPHPAAREEAPAHPFWTAERDALVIEAGGNWSELAALAIAFGRPMAALQQRWHRLRVA